MRSLLPRTMDEVRVKVPGVNHDSSCTRIGDQDGDLFLIRFRLGERVVKNDVYGVLDSSIRVELGDNHAVAVLIEHVGQAHHHHVVVVDDRHGDRTVHARSHHLKLPP